jgi:serine/threonine protein kinase
MSKLLSQGGYGCVYYPGISCDAKKLTDKKLVSKLQVDQEWTQREINLGKKITNINNFLWFFSPVIESCPIDIRKLNKSIVKDCDIIKDNKFDYKLMIIPYVASNPYLKSLLTNFDSRVLLYIIESNLHILNAISKLIKIGVIHLDIKSENLLLNDSTIPILIDFGISIDKSKLSMSNLNKYFYGYHPNYYIWCIEIHMINFFANSNLKKKITKKDIKIVCSDTIINNPRFTKAFSNEFIKTYYVGAYKYYKKYIGKKVEYIIKDLLKNTDTWDLYSFSIMNLQMLSYIFDNHYMENDILLSFYEIVVLGLHYDPSKRPDVNQYTSFLYNIKNKFDDIKKYRELRSSFNILIERVNI